MSVVPAYDFPLLGFWSNRAVAEYVCDIGGVRYVLRQLGDYLLYRAADNNCVEHTLFAPYLNFMNNGVNISAPTLKTDVQNSSHSTLADKPLSSGVYSQRVFAEQMANGQTGRVGVYACPEARDCNPILFFRQDGTGFFLDYHTANNYSAHEPTEQIDFTWNGAARGIGEGAGIMTAEWRQAEALCHDVFTSQVWPRMKDPFVSFAETPDLPLAWQCGSQEELIRITTCILHTEPGEWAELEACVDPFIAAENHCVPVAYAALMEDSIGGIVAGWPDRVRALCSLAFQRNMFTGYNWQYSRYGGETRRESYKRIASKQVCRISPPSAHERAESLLTLWEWLEGKVSEKERRAYLGMEE